MIVTVLCASLAFFVLFGVFGLVLNRRQAHDEESSFWMTLLAVTFSATCVMVMLFAPAIVLFALLLGAAYLYPDAAYYTDPWNLFALVLLVALSLFIYELLLEGFLTGLLRYSGWPASLAKVAEGLLTAALLVVGSEQIVRSVEVSTGAALIVGAGSAFVSYFLDGTYARPTSHS